MAEEIKFPVESPLFDEQGNFTSPWIELFTKLEAKLKDFEARIEALEP